MPKKISNFWIELAGLVALRARSGTPGTGMPTTGPETREVQGLVAEGERTSVKRKATGKKLFRGPPTRRG